MAKNVDSKGRPLFGRTPSQAHRNFGFDRDNWGGLGTGVTPSVPRPKFLFMVRFLRGAGQGSPKDWKRGVVLAVRKIDRPAIQPVVQEIKQYNRKRLIQTGVKYGPVTIELHDTADGVANQMWQEYAAYYFGDFRRSSEAGWNYDVTMGDFNDPSGMGFGSVLPAMGPNATEADIGSSGYFFDKIEVYQFFADQYLQYDLIHPRITSYNPDDLDYEQTGTNGIRITLEYETIIYHNDYRPARINGSDLAAVIAEAGIDGDVYNVSSGLPPSSIFNTNIPFFGNASRLLTKIPTTQYGVFGKVGKVLSNIPQIFHPEGTSSLGAFGNFDFGNFSGNALSTVGQAFANSITGGATTAVAAVASIPGVSAAAATVFNSASSSASSLMKGGGEPPPSLVASMALTASGSASSPFAALNSGATSFQVGKRTDTISTSFDPNSLS